MHCPPQLSNHEGDSADPTRVPSVTSFDANVLKPKGCEPYVAPAISSPVVKGSSLIAKTELDYISLMCGKIGTTPLII